MTFDEFKTLAKGLKSAYTTPNFLPDEYSVKVWFKFIEDLPSDLATMAVQKYISTNKFPPTIADIRGMVADMMTGSSDWSESWKQVTRCIALYGMPSESKAYDVMDEYTREAVKRLGWKNLCMSQNQTADRANYRMVYEAIIREKKDQLSVPENLRLKMENIKMLGD
jgi:hypothetical protein